MNNYIIYLINLEKDKERFAFMEKQLLDLHLNFEKIDAVYGKNLSKNDLEKSYDKEMSVKLNGKEMTLGEIGCAMSHKKVYKKFLDDVKKDNNLKYCIVLEDDVKLPFNLKNIIENEIVRNDVPNFAFGKIWDYLLFDYVQPGFIFLKFWLYSISYSFWLKIEGGHYTEVAIFILKVLIKFIPVLLMSSFEGVRNFYYLYFAKEGAPVRFYRSLYLAGCYIVTIKGVEQMLKINEKIVYPADRLPDEARKKGMKFYAYAPLCVKQRREEYGSSILDISGEDFKNGKNYKNNL
jgi:GR25 family glycosyltransferase involved in LPS biosynthesis